MERTTALPRNGGRFGVNTGAPVRERWEFYAFGGRNGGICAAAQSAAGGVTGYEETVASGPVHSPARVISPSFCVTTALGDGRPAHPGALSEQVLPAEARPL